MAQLLTLRLGSGKGQSILEVLKAMEVISCRSIHCAIIDLRPGKASISGADPSKTSQCLG